MGGRWLRLELCLGWHSLRLVWHSTCFIDAYSSADNSSCRPSMSSSCVNSLSSWSSIFLLSCGSTAPVEDADAPTLSAAALSAAALSPAALSAAATAALSAASLAVLSGGLGSAGLGVGGARFRGEDASSPLHASSSSSSLGGRRTPIVAAAIPTRSAGGTTAA